MALRSGVRKTFAPNENKMSDGGRGRASLGVEVWKSFEKWSAQRSAVRSIAWLDADDRLEKRILVFWDILVKVAVIREHGNHVPLELKVQMRAF